jgi:hypothetical protein
MNANSKTRPKTKAISHEFTRMNTNQNQKQEETKPNKTKPNQTKPGRIKVRKNYPLTKLPTHQITHLPNYPLTK